jgi:hypothetical protein
MNAREVYALRAAVAFDLRQCRGLALAEVARVLRLRSREEARRLCARGGRNLQRELGGRHLCRGLDGAQL